MTRVETILLVFIISTLLLLRPQSSIAADTCPSASNVLFARLDFRDGTERVMSSITRVTGAAGQVAQAATTVHLHMAVLVARVELAQLVAVG